MVNEAMKRYCLLLVVIMGSVGCAKKSQPTMVVGEITGACSRSDMARIKMTVVEPISSSRRTVELPATCEFDNIPVVGHAISFSGTDEGKCHDLGMSKSDYEKAYK